MALNISSALSTELWQISAQKVWFFQVLLDILLEMKKLIELKKLRSMPTHFPFSIQLEIEILFVWTKVKYLSYCAPVRGCIHVMHTHAPALDFSARRTARITDKETDESLDIFIIWKINSGMWARLGWTVKKKFGQIMSIFWGPFF